MLSARPDKWDTYKKILNDFKLQTKLLVLKGVHIPRASTEAVNASPSVQVFAALYPFEVFPDRILYQACTSDNEGFVSCRSSDPVG